MLMGEFNLYEEIQEAKQCNAALLNLITRFTPLLVKYAEKLTTEDAYFDLQLDFIELILKFDLDNMKRTDNAALLSYIKKAVYNSYIKRSKIFCEYRTKNYLFSEMSEEQFAVVSLQLSTNDSYDSLQLIECKKCLTSQEFEIILLLYYYGYGVAEISGLKNISRQAVNQIKRRALSKLYKQFRDVNIIKE